LPLRANLWGTPTGQGRSRLTTIGAELRERAFEACSCADNAGVNVGVAESGGVGTRRALALGDRSNGTATCTCGGVWGLMRAGRQCCIMTDDRSGAAHCNTV
jgi:hypothetical protein